MSTEERILPIETRIIILFNYDDYKSEAYKLKIIHEEILKLDINEEQTESLRQLQLRARRLHTKLHNKYSEEQANRLCSLLQEIYPECPINTTTNH